MQVVTLQQTKNKSTSAGFGQFSQVRYRGQTFTAAADNITGVLFYVQYDGGGGTDPVGYKLFIANVDQTTNLPTTDIASFEVPMSSLTHDKFNRFTLPTAITGLTVGTKYCFYLAPWNTTSTHTYTDYYRDLRWSNNAADFSGKALKNTNGVWSIETSLQMYFQLFSNYTMPTYTASYTQPALSTPLHAFNINSIDTQVISKNWDQGATEIASEVAALSALGANYIAIACPYDNPSYYKLWCDAIHAAGLKVYHRSHFNGWEGDNEFSVHLITADEYQARFYKFVQDNPTCFSSGDIVGICVESNRAYNAGNSVFTTSGAFDYTKYNDFQKKQVSVANKAFSDASLTGIHTWAISHSLSNLNLSGQTLDSGDTGNVNGLSATDIQTYFAGRLSFDHYLSDTYRQNNSNYWVRYICDLDKLHLAFPNACLLISEFGYHTTTNVSDDEQFQWFESMLKGIEKQYFVIGVNVWNHMGQLQSSLFTDSSGSIVTPGRRATQAVSACFGRDIASRGW